MNTLHPSGPLFAVHCDTNSMTHIPQHVWSRRAEHTCQDERTSKENPQKITEPFPTKSCAVRESKTEPFCIAEHMCSKQKQKGLHAKGPYGQWHYSVHLHLWAELVSNQNWSYICLNAFEHSGQWHAAVIWYMAVNDILYFSLLLLASLMDALQAQKDQVPMQAPASWVRQYHVDDRREIRS